MFLKYSIISINAWPISKPKVLDLLKAQIFILYYYKNVLYKHRND